MEIVTPRLALRPAGPEYLESTHRYASDPENARYMVFLPTESREETLRFLEDAAAEWQKPDPGYCEFVILREGEHIGGINLTFTEEAGTAELGWIIRRDCWGRGYATEAARALMAHARTHMGVRRFIAQCDSENAASWRLMEKLGMRRIDVSGGRKNRASDEERVEWTYEVAFEDESVQ